MKHLNTLTLLTFFAYFGTLHADEYYNYFKMTCDPLANSVKLENVDQWNDIPLKEDYTFKQKVFKKNDSAITSLKIYEDGECIFTDGKSVRIRLGTDRAFPYGQCGAAPALWFNLWINKKKILSHNVYNPTCNPGNTVESVNITDENITFNKYEVTGKFLFWSINKDITHFETMLIDNTLPIDDKEYPKVQEHLKIGDWKAFYESDEKFCSQFLDDNQFILPKRAQRLESGNFAPYEYNGNFEKMKDADYNNDGVIDEAYALHARTHYNDGDSYFIFSKENNVSKLWPNVNVTMLDKYKKNIFPNQLAGCARPKGCEYGEYTGIMMLTPDEINGEGYLSIRYIYSEPFVLDGSTYYVITYNNVQNSSGGQGKVILKPLPNNKAEHMCYFHKIIKNY